MKYYSIKPLLKRYPNAEFYMIYGEKSNGKTYSINELILRNYLETGEQGAYIRRWTEDIKGATPASMFSAIWANVGSQFPDYSGIVYYRRAWYLLDAKGKREKTPFCFAFSLGSVDHTNGSAFPGITTIFFDEFITRTTYLPDELGRWQVLLSNIIRDRGNVKIFMAGNTVSTVCPHFSALNFKPQQIQQGEMLLLERGHTRYAIEYAKATAGGKDSDKYFSGGKTVAMITRGAWEMADYPKAPADWSRKEVMFRFFLEFSGEWLIGDYISKNGAPFIFFYKKKNPRLYHPERDLCFSDQPSYRRNIYSSLRPVDDFTRAVIDLFEKGKIFYATDEAGETLRNFIIYSVDKTGIKRL